jgi:hypothetical protein
MTREPALTTMMGLLEHGTAGAHHAPAHRSAQAAVRVGSRSITYAQLRAQLNSAVLVGIFAPLMDPRQEGVAMRVQLEKAIRFNLLYQDALDQGKDGDPRHARAVRESSEGVMAEYTRAEGLHRTDAHMERLAELHATRLVNLHREDLEREMQPSDDELRAIGRRDPNAGLSDEATYDIARRLWAARRLNDYLIDLRVNKYPVVILDAELRRLYQSDRRRNRRRRPTRVRVPGE